VVHIRKCVLKCFTLAVLSFTRLKPKNAEYINPALNSATSPRSTNQLRSRHLQNPNLHEFFQHGGRTQTRRRKPEANLSLGSVNAPARKRQEALQQRIHDQLGRINHPHCGAQRPRTASLASAPHRNTTTNYMCSRNKPPRNPDASGLTMAASPLSLRDTLPATQSHNAASTPPAHSKSLLPTKTPSDETTLLTTPLTYCYLMSAMESPMTLGCLRIPAKRRHSPFPSPSPSADYSDEVFRRKESETPKRGLEPLYWGSF
jgi:hypothetical protein